MWIEELKVRGFKRLRGNYRFAQGLTVVVGPNEAGKSTLHEALVRVLFGFIRDERRKRSGRSEKDRRAPWEGGDFGISARVRDVRLDPWGGAEGVRKSLRIEWNFREHTVRVLDADTGSDLTSEVQGRLEDVGLGRRLLGLELDEFRAVCCLDQTAIDAVKRTEDLVLALQQSIESSVRDSGIEDALEILNQFLREDLGVHSLHLHPLPKGRLATLQRELERIDGDLQSSEAERSELERLGSVLAERESRCGRLRRRVIALERQSLLLELGELENRLEQARDLARRAEDVPHEVQQVPDGTVARLKDRRAGLARLEDGIRALRERTETAEPRLAALELEHARITKRVEELGRPEAAEPREEGGVRELCGRIAAVAQERRRIEPVAIPERDPTLARFRAEREKLIDLLVADPARGWNAMLLLAAGLSALGAVTAGVLVNPAFFALALVSAILVFAARPPSAGALNRGDPQAPLATYGAESLAELDARAADEDLRVASAGAQSEERQRQAAALETSRAQLEVELERALDRAGWPSATDLQHRVQAYLAACDRRAEGLDLQARLEALKREMGSVLQPARDLEQKLRERGELEKGLRELFGSCGVESSDLSRAQLQFDEVVRTATAHAERIAEAARARAALDALLRSRKLEELAAQAAESEGRLSDHVARFGELLPSPASSSGEDAARLQHPARERTRVQEELRQLELECTELRTKIRQREEALQPPAALRERKAELEEAIRRLERAREAVRIAREALKEAARETHRRFAPHLNAALERNLPRITAGRYRHAVVDDDLSIKVEAPETRTMVPVGELSRGTQDQIYLIQRLEIVRLLDPTTGEAPLLLDDPFARFDAERLRLALHVLRDVAAERQVVLFSEDSDVLREAREICRGCAMISLPAPSERAREMDVLQMALSWDD